MTNNVEPRSSGISGFLLGGAFVIVGFVFLVMQVFDLSFAVGSTLWPFFVIVPGFVLFALALATSGKEGERLAIVGSVVTMVGLLLFYQNTMDHWENWAYAWSLVMPTAVGIGQLLYGSLKHQPELARAGSRLIAIGLVIFLVGFFFFEVIIGISGFGFARFGLARFGWPMLLIGLGCLVILYNLLASRSNQPPHQGTMQ